MSNRNNAYTEVYTILQDLNEEEYNKIPLEVVKTIEQNMNEEYYYELDDELELKEQPMLPETKAILFNLFRDYLSTTEQKQKIIKMQNEERQKNEIKKQQMYNTNVFENIQQERQKNELEKQQMYNTNVFENRQQNSDTENKARSEFENASKEIQEQSNQLIEYKENIFKRILNKIKALFKTRT